MTCAIEGCEKPSRARGWCSKHYLRWWRNGDPVALIQRPKRDRTGLPFCPWCNRHCDGSCADLTPAEIAYTDRLVAAGVIGKPE